MDFSLSAKRYDTDGMFNSPPGPPSPNLPSRNSGQNLSKLDLIFSRPGGVLRNTNTVSQGNNNSDTRVQGPSALAHHSPTYLAHSFPPPSRSSQPTISQNYSLSSQRSPVIVNNREQIFQLQQRDEPVRSREPPHSSIGLVHSGSGIAARTVGNGVPIRFVPRSSVDSMQGMRFRMPNVESSQNLRSPPMYDTVRHLQSSSRGSPTSPQAQRMSLRPAAPPTMASSRPLRFAPPMRPPPPPPQRTEPPRHIRDYVIHSNLPTSSSSSPAGRPMSHDPDTLAKISELAKITRASIPMSPLEDENEYPARRDFIGGNSLRDLMPPPASRVTAPSGRTLSPAGIQGRSTSSSMSQEAMNAVASQLGIQVEVVHKLAPPPPIVPTLRTRFPALPETNLGFSNFASAVAFLTLDEPPLNPLEIESSKDVLISIFGPKMTLYRCGGCESTFVFRNVFSDHLYRGIVPYRLRCSHCKDTMAFTNICQVKDHVRSHGYTNFQMAKGFVLTVAEVNDENTQPGESVGAKLAAEQLAKAAAAKSSSGFTSVSTGNATAGKSAATTSNKMLQAMLKSTEEPAPDVPRMVLQPQQSSRPPPPPEMAPYRTPQPSTSAPARNSAAHALQRLRLQVEAQALIKSQAAEFSASPPGAGRTSNSGVQQGLLRQIIRTSNSPHTSSSPSSFDPVRTTPKIPCPYCRSTFDGQSGLTHHFQRFKDVVDAATNYRCKECKVVCCNQCSYDAHQKIHHLNRSSPNMTDICCPECGFKLDNIDEITSHVERRCVHWCRMLCVSINCCMQNCRFSSTNEEDYFTHLINSHSGQPDGRNCCPACRIPVNGPRTVLMEHLSLDNSCRQQVLQQKSMFFAYHCVYCEEKTAPVFETKAAMRDHIAHAHPGGLPKSAAFLSSQQSATNNLVLAHAKRISSFNDFETAFKKAAAGNGSGGGSGVGVVNSLLARRTAGNAPSLQPGPSGIYPTKTFPRMDRSTTQAPAPANSAIIQNLSLLKRTLTEEDAKPPPIKKVRLTAAFGCQLCSFEGRSHEELAAHMDHHQTRDLSGKTDLPPSKAAPKRIMRYDCSVCEMDHGAFSCDSADVFHDHVRRHHPAKDTSFQCSECGLQLLSMSVLQMHLQVKHNVADTNAFFASSPFYAGMRTLRTNPTANFVSALHRSASSMGGSSDQQPQRPPSGTLRMTPTSSSSSIFQHSSSSLHDQSGGTSSSQQH